MEERVKTCKLMSVILTALLKPVLVSSYWSACLLVCMAVCLPHCQAGGAARARSPQPLKFGADRFSKVFSSKSDSRHKSLMLTGGVRASDILRNLCNVRLGALCCYYCRSQFERTRPRSFLNMSDPFISWQSAINPAWFILSALCGYFSCYNHDSDTFY